MKTPLSPNASRPHQIRELPIQVERLPSGGIRVTTPLARGWAAVAHDQHELARSIATAFTEAEVASYSRFRGQVYDLDALTGHVPGDALAGSARGRVRGPAGRRRAKKSYPVTLWQKLPDGRWRSPSGRAYRADTRAVQQMVARRVAEGLPV